MDSHKVEVKPYSTKEIIALYGITAKTFRTWILPFQGTIGPRIGRYYTLRQIRIIFERIGFPGNSTLMFLPLFLPLLDSHEYLAFGIVQGMA